MPPLVETDRTSLTGHTDPLPEPYASLERRIGRAMLDKRLRRELDHLARLSHQGEGIFRLEALFPHVVDNLTALALRLTGLAGRARRNFLNPRIVERRWQLPHLPKSFDGFRLLQLTDLHFDLDPAFTPALIEKLKDLDHDAVVITGDFRNSTNEDHGPSFDAAKEVIACLKSPCFAILGNHDFIELVPALEPAGLPFLLNEVAFLSRGEDRLWIAGIDDPHFYHTHDLRRIADALPPDACTVLLSHSPEIVKEPIPDCFDLILCGHTHGGQICLPGGRWVHVPVHGLESEFIKGPWRYGNAQGYTSPGTGACGVAGRLNCPGEITVHILTPKA